MQYRPEIDGLRALAVVPVILFHAGFELFGGGFVGVDIFFVISGYLITGIIINDIEAQKFSILNFYERRSRRILPALLFVVVCTFIAAQFILVETELDDLGKSFISVAIFASNIFFWNESGYFDTASELKPLLHTWSLAVEEQYYVLFPIFLFLLWRFGKSKVFWIIVAVAVVSLGLSEWAIRQGERYQSANFYLLPTRAWELLAGSIAAFIVHEKGVRSNNWLSLVGLLAIIFSIFAYDKTTPFPSLYALVPILGVVLLILFAAQDTITGKFLSMKLFVGIGLISYSAYLWHQPLLALTRRAVNHDSLGLGLPIEHLGLVQISAIIAATFLLAYFSWAFVEQPFRKRTGDGLLGALTWLYGSLAALGVIGLMGYAMLQKSDDAPGGIPIAMTETWAEDARQRSCFLSGRSELVHATECLAPRGVLILGDSHAASLAIGLRSILTPQEIPFSQLNQGLCPPLLDLPVMTREICGEANRKILLDLAEAQHDVIILHAGWLHQHYPLSPSELSERVVDYVQRLRQINSDAQIVVVGPVPRFRFGPQNATRDLIVRGDQIYSSEFHILADTNATLQATVAGIADPQVQFVDPFDGLCEQAGATPHCLFAIRPTKEDEYAYTYIDDAHLSDVGSQRLARFVLNQLPGETFQK